MKRFAAIVLIVVLCALCGCNKETENNSSDTGGSFVADIYEKILKNAESTLQSITSPNKKNTEENVNSITINPVALKFQSDKLIAYNLLNENQKKLYSIMLTAINDLELRNIDITKYCKRDDISDISVAHKALICDQTDIFWMPKSFSVLSSENNDIYLSFSDVYDGSSPNGYYGISKDERDEMQKKLIAVTQTVINTVNSLDSDFEKELYIHDYICENTVYDSFAADSLENAPQNTLSSYGALVEGKAICEGYSKAFKYLCDKAGIPCSLVLGKYEDTPHMWNIVFLDEGYYYVDVTFDDSSDISTLHTYFNNTKQYALKDHIFDSAFSTSAVYNSYDSFNFFSPDCDNTDMNYFEKTGSYITYDCVLAADTVIRNNQNGKYCAELENRTGFTANEAFAILKRALRKQVRINKYYIFKNSDIMVVVWQ